MRSILPVVAVILSIFLAGTAQAADILVLDASAGLAMHKGDILDGAHEIALPAGARLVLMDASGRTVALEGPFRGVPGGKPSGTGPGVLQRLSAMVMPGAAAERGTSIGAVRDVTARDIRRRDRPADPWVVDVSAPGDRCVRRGTPRVWRRDTSADQTLVMRREPSSDWVRVPWPASQATVPWPHDLSRADGARYRVMLEGPLSTRFITLHVARARFANDAARLAWLYESGCRDQADVLIDRLAAANRVTGKAAARRGVFGH